MLGKMKGWNFRVQKLSADGSTTLDTLRAEKARLEKRLAEIPGLITRVQSSINTLQGDISWLKSLSDRKAKDWAKDNGKSVSQAIYDGSNILVGYNADLSNLNNELSRIPAQIKDVDSQIAILVKGEGDGLSKGLDGKTSMQLGEIELQKQKDILAHQQAIQQVELAKVTSEAQQAPEPSKTNWTLIIGCSLAALAIIGYFIYKSKQAKVLPLIKTVNA